MNQTYDLRYPQWQGPLQEAILEFDGEELTEKAHQAEAAILERLRELRQSTDGYDEQAAISYGLSLLRSIKAERLGYPDWRESGSPS